MTALPRIVSLIYPLPFSRTRKSKKKRRREEDEWLGWEEQINLTSINGIYTTEGNKEFIKVV
jgi:hypothetical protein